MAAPRIVVTGFKEIDAKLQKLEYRVQRKLTRQSLRKAAKEIILPEARARAPHDTGKLESEIRVRAAKRSRSGFGYVVGFDPKRINREEAIYFNAQEFGFKTKGGGRVEGQRYLRAAGYGNEQRVERLVIDDLREVIRET